MDRVGEVEDKGADGRHQRYEHAPFHLTENVIKEDSQPATFEEAITATGFGKYNVFLMIVTIFPSVAEIFEVVALSYVLPIAECDLNLTLSDKGMLNAMTFAGMVTSALFWGLLCDMIGRKSIIKYGYLVGGGIAILVSLSTNITLLSIAKFCGGFIINGPYSASVSHLSEFHSSKYRARVQIVRGATLSSAYIFLPLLAWGILPQKLDFSPFGLIALISARETRKEREMNVNDLNMNLVKFNAKRTQACLFPRKAGLTVATVIMSGVSIPMSFSILMFGININYHSWNVFLLVCALPTISSGLIYFFVPESPKFLMTLGRNEEAMDIFRKVYRINTGNAEDTFPIKYLVKETYFQDNKISEKKRFGIIQEGILQMKPFLSSPHISRILLICSNAFLLTMSMNLVKLWLPQIFQATSDHQISESRNETDVCSIFEELRKPNLTVADGCTVNLDNMSVYINSIIVGISGVIAFCFAGTLVNLLGKKTLTIAFTFAAGCFCCSVYFSGNSLTMMILYSLDLSLGCIADNVLTTTTLELFPTTLRTSALCLHLMFGRFGTVVGNIILPQLLQIGCAPPIFFLGILVYGSLVLTLLYPSTENKPLL